MNRRPKLPSLFTNAHPLQQAGIVVAYATMIMLGVAYLLPFAIEVASSFKSDAEVLANPLGLVPDEASLHAYRRLLSNSNFPLWTLNSVIVTVFVTAGRVFFDSLAGYALARLKFPGRRMVMGLLVAIMAVPGVVLLIPRFLVINQLGIYDSYVGMILPLLVDAFGVFVMKNFFEAIPASVEEAARIDGAGAFRTFWSIVLPMARPAVMTITILSFEGSWNILPHFIISTQDPALTTLTKGVAQLSAGELGAGTQYPLKLAAAVLMTLPVAIVFLIAQRHFMNVSTGAVKE